MATSIVGLVLSPRVCRADDVEFQVMPRVVPAKFGVGRWGMYRRTVMKFSTEGVCVLSVPGRLAEVSNDDSTSRAECRKKKQGWPRSCNRQ